MRKLVLVLFAFIFFTGVASAQYQYVPNFNFGIKAGANYSLFPQPGDYKNKGEFGYIGGIYARFGGEGLFFQPELYVNSKNTRVTQNEPNADVNYANFNSVDLPLLVGYKTGSNAQGFRVYTGPAISFAASRNQTFLVTSNNVVRLDYDDVNYAWQFGTGLDFNNLAIDIRYEAGLKKIGYGLYETMNTKLNLISLTLSYSLDAEDL